jgi:hypothetical protein
MRSASCTANEPWTWSRIPLVWFPLVLVNRDCSWICPGGESRLVPIGDASRSGCARGLRLRPEASSRRGQAPVRCRARCAPCRGDRLARCRDGACPCHDRRAVRRAIDPLRVAAIVLPGVEIDPVRAWRLSYPGTAIDLSGRRDRAYPGTAIDPATEVATASALRPDGTLSCVVAAATVSWPLSISWSRLSSRCRRAAGRGRAVRWRWREALAALRTSAAQSP